MITRARTGKQKEYGNKFLSTTQKPSGIQKTNRILKLTLDG